MNVLPGLYSYEIVLLLLGVILFLALLVALLRNVFQDKPYAALIPAFFIPIVMIGYPSIQSVKYQNGLVEIQKATEAVQSDPSNSQAKAQLRELQAKVNKIEPRAGADPQAAEILRKASLILGQPLSDVRLRKARVEEMEKLTKAVSTNPKDQNARDRLKKAIPELENMGGLDPTDAAAIKQAENALRKN